MTWLHWVLIAAVILAVRPRWVWWPYDLFAAWRFPNASRSDGEMTGAGADFLPPLAARPGPIRGPLNNGRR